MTTKETIQQSHEANEWLQAPFMSQVPQDDKDLSTDQPTRMLESTVIASTIEALESGQTHYVDVPGILPLREAVASFLSTQGISGYDASTIVITASVQEARFLALQTLTEGSVAMPEVVHPGAKKALGVRPPALHSLSVDKNNMLATLDGVPQALEQGIKVVYLESPVRLTGAVYETTAIAQMSQLIASHGATLICDQGLSPWVTPYPAVAAPHTTLIGDVFPGVGLEGLSLGYIATSSEQVGAMTSLKQIMSICTSTPSQYAALKLSENYEAKRSELLEVLRESRQAVVGSGTDYLLGHAANLVAVKKSEALMEKLHEHGFSYADGAAFGAADTVRLSVTPTLTQALGAAT